MATYDELYCRYNNCVVLMLKQYMYVAHDESARVLSALLEYKLFDSRDGISACGPDKEKIMSVLSAHHVNYIISEYGKITESEFFEDNCFSKYHILTADISVEPYIPSAKSPLQHSSDEKQPFEDDQSCMDVPDWLVEGLSVVHNDYGNGTISSIRHNKSNITFLVSFAGEKTAWFRFPDAFENNNLMIENAAQ